LFAFTATINVIFIFALMTVHHLAKKRKHSDFQ